MTERRRGGLWTLAFLLFVAVDCCLVSAAAGAWYYFVERGQVTATGAASTEYRLVDVKPTDGMVTREDELTVSGRIEPATRGEAHIQGRLLTVGEDGRFSLSGISLREGSNRISLVVHPAGGPSDTPLTQVARVVRDTEPPRLVLESPLEEVAVATASVVLRVRVEDHSPWTQVTLGKRDLRIERGHRVEEVVKLAPGQNRFELQAVDAAGNRARALVVTINRR